MGLSMTPVPMTMGYLHGVPPGSTVMGPWPGWSSWDSVDLLKTCVFPFTYKGKNYTECAPYPRGSDSEPEDSNTPFCATAVKEDGTHADWGYCLPDCPGAGPAALAIQAVGGEGKSRGHRCVLPFKDDGKWYVGCKQKSAKDKRKWCPTQLKENG